MSSKLIFIFFLFLSTNLITGNYTEDHDSNDISTVKEDKDEKQEALVIRIIAKVYVTACYIIMTCVVYRFYEDYQKIVNKEKEAQQFLDSPSIRGFFKVVNNTLNQPSQSKIHDEEYMDKKYSELFIAFILAPLAVPYYTFFKEEFPKL